MIIVSDRQLVDQISRSKEFTYRPTTKSNLVSKVLYGDYIIDQRFLCSPRSAWTTEETLIYNKISNRGKIPSDCVGIV
jgi:hypothetical protein